MMGLAAEKKLQENLVVRDNYLFFCHTPSALSSYAYILNTTILHQLAPWGTCQELYPLGRTHLGLLKKESLYPPYFSLMWLSLFFRNCGSLLMITECGVCFKKIRDLLSVSSCFRYLFYIPEVMFNISWNIVRK